MSWITVLIVLVILIIIAVVLYKLIFKDILYAIIETNDVFEEVTNKFKRQHKLPPLGVV